MKFDEEAIQKSLKDLTAAATQAQSTKPSHAQGAQGSQGAGESSHQRQRASPLCAQTSDELLTVILQAQRRNLDEWCFVERYSPEVMLQQLRSASYELRQVETYYCKRDMGLALVLHNPQDKCMKSYENWHRWLHTDLGFRSYLEYVAGMFNIYAENGFMF